MLDLKNYEPRWFSTGEALLESEGKRLLALVGQRVSGLLVACIPYYFYGPGGWDWVRDVRLWDYPVIVAVGDVNLEVLATNNGRVALSWNSIDTQDRQALCEGDSFHAVVWTSELEGNAEFTTVVGRCRYQLIQDVHLIDFHDSRVIPGNLEEPYVEQGYWTLAGVGLRFTHWYLAMIRRSDSSIPDTTPPCQFSKRWGDYRTISVSAALAPGRRVVYDRRLSNHPGGAPSDNSKNLGLMEAVRLGRVDHVVRLLNQGADVDYWDQYSETTPLSVAFANSQLDIAGILLDRGACPAQIGDHLLYAAKNGNVEMARLLLERGADVNTADDDKKTPLALAIDGGHAKIVELLIDRGVRVTCDHRNEANKKGNKEIAQLLVEGSDSISICRDRHVLRGQ